MQVTSRGLASIPRCARPFASTTVFTFTLDGTTHVTKAYALGILDTQPDGMPDQEYAARTRLLEFQNLVQDLRGSL